METETRETLIVWSMWCVAYATTCGVEIVGSVDGYNGRMGWQLANDDGQAQTCQDEWRRGVAVANARALLDAHKRLMDDVKNRG